MLNYDILELLFKRLNDIHDVFTFKILLIFLIFN